MEFGIKCMMGNHTVGDAETYISPIQPEWQVPGLQRIPCPGMYGNLILVARVEDNDQYGNPLVEKTIFWNVAIKQSKNFFDQRTLWSTRFRRPFWLLFLAYSCESRVRIQKEYKKQ